jgi:hypothetical protein
METIGVIESKNSNLGMWKTTRRSTKGIVIPFTKNGMTPTSIT